MIRERPEGSKGKPPNKPGKRRVEGISRRGGGAVGVASAQKLAAAHDDASTHASIRQLPLRPGTHESLNQPLTAPVPGARPRPAGRERMARLILFAPSDGRLRLLAVDARPSGLPRSVNGCAAAIRFGCPPPKLVYLSVFYVPPDADVQRLEVLVCLLQTLV